jgi:gluconate:H+ symporter, GntP family
MSVLVIAAIGVGLVLVSILVLKLHPLISLLLASLLLFIMTPLAIRRENALRSDVIEIKQLDGSAIGFTRAVPPGRYVLLNDRFERQDEVRLSRATDSSLDRPADYYWYAVEDYAAPLTLDRRMVVAERWDAFDESPLRGAGLKVAAGFAETFRKLGIPVTMAAIIGVCLLESRAASRLVGVIMAIFGRRGTAPALTVSGFTLGIPVYFDNVFYLLLPLAKAVGRTRPEAYLSAVMAIVVGATMAHSLVPPTPGPLLVASQVGVSLGEMMLGGLIVGGVAASVGLLYGMLCRRWIHLVPDQEVTTDADPVVDASEQTKQPAIKRQVPLWMAVLPIGLPILLLGGSEIISSLAELRGPDSRFARWEGPVSIFNDPNLIFLITALLAIGILRYVADGKAVSRTVAKGIADAGTIVLLTCAGGAFGSALQQLQLAGAIASEFENLSTPWGLLLTAFVLTTIIRAAQGSATVAMITSVAIVAPVMQSIELPFNQLYIALAIGCGSKPLPWMNDSGFWQVATMTGMSTSQTLQTFTVALTLMGLTGFLVTCLGAWLIPLI